MLLELTKLNQLPVASFEEGKAIGRVKKSIISKQEGRVLGFLVKIKGLFAPEKVASLQDVVSIDQAAVVLRSNESLVEKDEVVRISEIVKSNFSLLGLKAQTKDRKNLGNVTDALIDSETGNIMRLYVRHYFRNAVYERSQIFEIKRKYVILQIEKKKRIKEPAAALVQAETA